MPYFSFSYTIPKLFEDFVKNYANKFDLEFSSKPSLQNNLDFLEVTLLGRGEEPLNNNYIKSLKENFKNNLKQYGETLKQKHTIERDGPKVSPFYKTKINLDNPSKLDKETLLQSEAVPQKVCSKPGSFFNTLGSTPLKQISAKEINSEDSFSSEEEVSLDGELSMDHLYHKNNYHFLPDRKNTFANLIESKQVTSSETVISQEKKTPFLSLVSSEKEISQLSSKKTSPPNFDSSLPSKDEKEPKQQLSSQKTSPKQVPFGASGSSKKETKLKKLTSKKNTRSSTHHKITPDNQPPLFVITEKTDEDLATTLHSPTIEDAITKSKDITLVGHSLFSKSDTSDNKFEFNSDRKNNLTYSSTSYKPAYSSAVFASKKNSMS